MSTKKIRRQQDIEQLTSELTGVDKDVVKTVIDGAWDVITNEIEHGNTIKLHGKGKFYLSKRSSRMGRNPLTGEQHKVPAREVMVFQVSPAYAKKLREVREKQSE